MNETRRPLRIVHLDTGRELRGGQWQLLQLAHGLRQRGHSLQLVCAEGSALEQRARHEGYPVFELPAHDPAHLFGALLLRRWLAAQQPDILHAHDGRGQTLGWLASEGIKVRRVASRRVSFIPNRFLLARTCHGIIAVSESVRDSLLHAGVPESKVTVIPDGVQIPGDLPTDDQRARARAKWKVTEQNFVLGQLGAFSPEKGQDTALEAMLILREKLPAGALLLAGPQRRKIPAKLQRLLEQSQNRVRLVGAVEDLSDFFAALDLFIMPSRTEGLGSAALLAMAHGLPVVASRVGGLPQVVVEGRTGSLIPPDSPAALAEAILTAAQDRQGLRRLGANARERAREFSSDIMVGRSEEFYFRLLAR